MARLYMAGWELNTTTAGVEFTAAAGANPQTSVVRSGTYAAFLTALSSGVGKNCGSFQFAAANGNGPYFGRVYLRVATRPSAANRIIGFQNTAAGYIAFIKLNADGTLQLADEDGDIGSPSSVIPLNDFEHRIELKVDRTPSAGSHVVEARLNGTVFATSSARNLSTGVALFSVGGNLASEAQTQGDWYFDDYAINDSTGSIQNDYPGPENVIVMVADGDGDAVEWTGTWQDIDELPPDDATTSISSGTLNAIEWANLAATPAALLTGSTINVVSVGVRFRRGNNTQSPAFTTVIEPSSGATNEQSAPVTPTSTTWFTNAVAAPRIPPLTLYDLPGASTTAWTKADLDTAQIAARISTGAALTSIQVSTLWLTVGYNPPTVVSPSVVASTASVPAPTVTVASHASVSASVVSATASVGAPVVATGTTTAPASVAASASVPAPTLATGSTVASSTVASAASVAAPTITASSDVAPSTVAVTASVPAPAVTTGSTAAPSVVAAAGSVGAPTITTGSAVAVATVATTASVPAPSVSTGSSVDATTVAATASVPDSDVVVSAHATAEPATAEATASVPAVAVTIGADAAVSVVSATASVPAPSFVTGSAIAVSTVEASASVGAPSVIDGTSVAAAVVAASAVVHAPGISTGSVVVAAVVQATATVPASTQFTQAVVTAAVVQATASVSAPSLSTGSTALVLVVAAVASVPAVVIPTDASAAASTVVATASVGSVVVAISVTVEPSTVGAVASFPTLELTAGSSVTPSAVHAIASVLAPVVVALFAKPRIESSISVSSAESSTITATKRDAAISVSSVESSSLASTKRDATTTSSVREGS